MTLATVSHLPQAVTALSSARAHNPAISRAVLLLLDADVPGRLVAAPDLEIITLGDLGPADEIVRMREYYTAFEFCCALKPSLIQYIQGDLTDDRWIYLDADTWCVGPLAGLDPLWDSADTILTLHARASGNSAEEIDTDLGLCRYGVMNAGVIAGSRSAATAGFLAWWHARLVAHGRFCAAEGEYLDQRWLDLARSYFPGVHAARVPGINIGHWNIHELRVHDSHLVETDGTPVSLFHFSQIGVDDAAPDFRRLPTRASPTMDAFLQWARQYHRAVNEWRRKMEGAVGSTGPVVAARDGMTRDILIRAVYRSRDPASGLAAALQQLPALRRERARAELHQAWGHLRAGLGALKRSFLRGGQ